MAVTTTDQLTIHPFDGALGAEVRGNVAGRLDGGLAGADVFTLLDGLRQHQVLVIKEQTMSDEQLLELASYFGPQFIAPDGIPVLGTDEQGAVTVLSNRDDKGVGSRVALPFHTDFQFMPVPLLGAVLHAVTVPPQDAGGDTLWSNMYLALDELPAELREKIEGRRGIGINPYANGIGGAGFTGDTQKYSDDVVPDFPHPLIRTHPDTGRQSLYFSMFIIRIEGYEDRPEEEQELLQALRDHVDQDKYYYRHKWNEGDTIIWDNRCTNHKRDDFDQAFDREVHRVQIAGTKPF